MKKLKHIQNLSLFFTLTFAMSLFVLIWVFQDSPYVVGGLSLLCLLGCWVMVRFVMTLKGFVHDFAQKEARLKLLASRDPATGLFHRNGFEVLLAREIERAKRKDYNLALVLIQVEPYQKIENDIGGQAMDRLLFQIAETLQNTCRIYDGLFKLDHNTFCLYFSETHVSELTKIIQRMQRRLEKSSFLVSAERVKVTPNFQLGAALYPMDGTNPQSLEDFARENLSETFDLSQIRHPDRPHNDFYDEPVFEGFDQNKLEDTEPQKDDQPALQNKEVIQKTITTEISVTEDVIVVPTKTLDSSETVSPTLQTAQTKWDVSKNQDSSPKIDFDDIDTQKLQGTQELQDFQNEMKSLFERTDKIEEHVEKLLDDEVAVAKKPAPANESKEQVISDLEEDNNQDIIEIELGLVSFDRDFNADGAVTMISHNQDEKTAKPLPESSETLASNLSLEPLPDLTNKNAAKKSKPTLLDARKIEEIHDCLKELDKQSEDLETRSQDVLIKAQDLAASKESPELPKENAQDSFSQNNDLQNNPTPASWSVDEIADMPDVVAALMQSEISNENYSPIARQSSVKTKEDSSSFADSQNESAMPFDFQK